MVEAAKVTNPLLRYHGGKWRIAPWVISHFPQHSVYVEPFGGGASVLLRKHPVRTEIYNDLDREIYNLFWVIRNQEHGRRLADMLEITPFSREEYVEAYWPSACFVEQARRTIVKSFMGMGSKGIWIKSGFDARINAEALLGRLDSFARVPEVVRQCIARLASVVLENCDALELIRRYQSREDCLFYIDPPYVSHSYDGGRVYRHTLTDDYHRELAGVLNNVAGMVVVSGYPSALYDEIYQGWEVVQRAALADGAKKRTECLWLRNTNVQAQLFGGVE